MPLILLIMIVNIDIRIFKPKLYSSSESDFGFETFYFHGIVTIFITSIIILMTFKMNSSFVFTMSLIINLLWRAGNRKLNTFGTKSMVCVSFIYSDESSTHNSISF